jgi:two-component system NtrC family response regulator
MQNSKILIVDDEAPQRSTLAGFLKKRGYTVIESDNGSEAVDIVRDGTIDLILTDLRMPKMDGLELLKQVKEINPLVEVMVSTAYGTIESAVEAMQVGAFNYIQKPVDLANLEIQVERAIERKQLQEEVRELRAITGKIEGSDLIASSEEMREVLGIVSRAAPSKASVMILGESGTGKEMIARAIHNASPRKEKPFVAVNIAAIPETLLESELFGHEKGSFTGATERLIGRFERASGGTLFIDEVGDMPMSAQVKLLRVLQEGKIERVGGKEEIEVDVRIVAATNADFDKNLAEGSFREDLYYRLNVVKIDLPPLRKRKTDIPHLIEYFIKKYAALNDKEVEGFNRDAIDILLKFEWPGNVRELENAVESAVVLSRNNVMGPRDLPPNIRESVLRKESAVDSYCDDNSMPLPDRVEAFEKSVVLKTLQEVKGNQSEAARRLGLSEKAIRYRLKRWEENE